MEIVSRIEVRGRAASREVANRYRVLADECEEKATHIERASAYNPNATIEFAGGQWVAGMTIEGCGIHWEVEAAADDPLSASIALSDRVLARATFLDVAILPSFEVRAVTNLGCFRGKLIHWTSQLTFAAKLDEDDLAALEDLGIEVDAANGGFLIVKDRYSSDGKSRPKV
jgi:hypothetical protein